MRDSGASVLIVSKLDELAWLFNMRGGDIPFSPTFWGFGLVGAHYVRLYIKASQLTKEAGDVLKKANVQV